MSQPILHIFEQAIPHDNAFLVGNRAGLEKLAELIHRALDGSPAGGLFTTNDEENYCPIVTLMPDDLIDQIPLPYSMEGFGSGQKKLIPDIVSREEYRRIRDEVLR